MDMAKHLNCNPNFDYMEWYEFMSKYEILKNKVKDSKESGMDFLQGFKNFLGK
jgi:hypothetical protein